MKTILFLCIKILLMANDVRPEKIGQEQWTRSIAYSKQDACTNAKAEAQSRYVLTNMDWCQCEKTDAGEWMCDVRFWYSEKKEVK